jgi:hypothetical protein
VKRRRRRRMHTYKEEKIAEWKKRLQGMGGGGEGRRRGRSWWRSMMKGWLSCACLIWLSKVVVKEEEDKIRR